MLDHLVGVSQVGHVLAEEREEGADIVLPEVHGSLQRGLESLARQKTPHRALSEPPPRHMRREPPVLRAPQKQPSHQAHTVMQARCAWPLPMQVDYAPASIRRCRRPPPPARPAQSRSSRRTRRSRSAFPGPRRATGSTVASPRAPPGPPAKRSARGFPPASPRGTAPRASSLPPL